MNDSDIAPANWTGGDVPSLEAGLAALKRKDYQTAIAHLTALCQTTSDRQSLAKAQMGLVKAYEHIGDLPQAIAFCKSLQGSTSQQVRSWATHQLEELSLAANDTPAAAAVSSAASDTTGFVPFTEIPQSAIREQVSAIDPPPVDVDSPRDADGLASADQEFDNPFSLSNQESIAPPATADNPSLPELPLPLEPILPTPAPVEAQPSAAPQPLQWLQAGRAQKWPPLAATRLEQLGLLEVGTAIALFWVVRTVLWTTLNTVNDRLAVTVWPFDLRSAAIFYHDPFWFVLLVLIALLASSPWLLDVILRQYRLKPLSPSTLEQYSPEANRLLKRVCSQRRMAPPTLSLLPVAAPLAFTYGCLPQTARMVVSQGLLDQLNDDEIAAIYAAELGHIVYWDFVPMTLVTLVAQLPYQVYWQVAVWGDRQSNGWLRSLAAVVSAIGYGLYWLFRAVGLWLSRSRLYYSDQFASNVTGNPNGLSRALLKIALGTATAIQQRGSTSPLLESFDLLAPVGYRTALSLGSVYPALSAAALSWDLKNPGRGWLTINNAHPLMGDRLRLLNHYARHWRLNLEVDLEPGASTARNSPQLARAARRIRLQGAPFLGVFVGLAIALLLWTVGTVADWGHWSTLSWLRGDRSVLWGFGLIGCSVGFLLRINAYFPDIRSTNLQINPSLPDLLRDSAALPIDSQPVRLRGKLLGRRGIESWLVQDLMLQTDTGLIKLHYLSQLGTIGNLLLHPQRPDLLVNQSVMVTGWFRRGATLWIDVDVIQPQRGTTIRSGHPLASTLLAGAMAVAGSYIIARGNF